MTLSEHISKLEIEISRLKELREGDNKLIIALAEGMGIEIHANPRLLGAVWEEFHDGCIALKKERDELYDQVNDYHGNNLTT